MLVMLFVMFMSFGVVAYADDLNGVEDINNVGTETTENVKTDNETPTTNDATTKDTNTNSGTNQPLQPTNPEKQKKIEDTSKAIGDMFSGAGPDEEAINEANEFLRPFAVIMNKLMAIILGITSLLMTLVTVLDLLYMAFPPVRDMLDGGMSGGQQMQGGRGSRGTGMRRGIGGIGGMGGMGGMGMGGMGMGSMGMGGMDGGMGMGGMQGGRRQQQQSGGGLSAIGRWVSDEAIAACMETGGGGMAAMSGQQPGPIKSMIFSYMKKRSMFLILFGVCVILFTSTVFTDLGIKIGTWLLGIIMGFGS